MNKTELIAHVVEATGLSKKDAEKPYPQRLGPSPTRCKRARKFPWLVWNV